MMHLDCLLKIHGGLAKKAKGFRPLESRLFGAIRETASDPERTLLLPRVFGIIHR